MTAPSLPDGYDVTKHVRTGRSDRHVTVGFDREGTRIPRFLIQLHYQKTTTPVRWTAIARMDHNDTADDRHDVYLEGLHVDVSRREGETVHLQLRHAPLSPNRGVVIRRSAEYLIREGKYFVDVYDGRIAPTDPPRWPDSGDTAPTFITSKRVNGDVSRESPAEDALTENQGESLALQGGDESDNSPTCHRLIARQDIPHCANTHTIN